MVVVSRFEIAFCHADVHVSVRETRCCCDSAYVNKHFITSLYIHIHLTLILLNLAVYRLIFENRECLLPLEFKVNIANLRLLKAHYPSTSIVFLPF